MKKEGFTLVELLISVLIIGVLISAIVVVINPALIRARTRDARRVSDIKTIQTALEQYYLVKRAYPASRNGNTSTNESPFDRVENSTDRISCSLKAACSDSYDSPVAIVDSVPIDPNGLSGNDTPCSGTQSRYSYWAPARASSGSESYNADKYMLVSIMETASGNDGYECSNLNNWTSSVCSPTFSSSTQNDICFGVENK